jgi:hypothetical protein
VAPGSRSLRSDEQQAEGSLAVLVRTRIRFPVHTISHTVSHRVSNTWAALGRLAEEEFGVVGAGEHRYRR